MQGEDVSGDAPAMLRRCSGDAPEMPRPDPPPGPPLEREVRSLRGPLY